MLHKKILGFGKKLIGGISKPFKSLTGAEEYKMAPTAYQGQQNQLVDMLMAQARGQGPSIAQEQMKRGIASNLAGVRGSLQGMSGVSQGTRARLFSRQAGASGRELAAQGGLMRAQEMAGARSNLANMILGSQAQQTARSGVAYKAHEGAQQRRQGVAKGIGGGVASFFGMG